MKPARKPDATNKNGSPANMLVILLIISSVKNFLLNSSV
jgi:hypothetical protein